MSKDTIYREDVINTLADMHCRSDEDGYAWIIRSDALARIDAVPSAQPEQETGRWKTQTIMGKQITYCSKCGFGKHINETRRYSYCPNCGEKMEGTDE